MIDSAAGCSATAPDVLGSSCLRSSAFLTGALLLLSVTGACTADAGPLPIENFQEISSPPVAGSGEAHLVLDGPDVLLSWLEPVPDVTEAQDPAGGGENRHALRMARLAGGEWEQPRQVATGADFFVNWADFPSVVPVAPGFLAAHWLVRGEEGGYDYAIHVAVSSDDGRSWSDSWTPHGDGTPTEHGFVSILPMDGESMGVIWLDGRDYASSAVADGEADPQMALRFRQVALAAAEEGTAHLLADAAGDEIVLDSRVCDCCQTSAARTDGGFVAVYRDRSQEEVRDISTVRLQDGQWTQPAPVHEDGWVIDACPVNGPAVAASGERVAAAWFTSADDIPKVLVAFSSDGGARFDEPIEIDGGNPSGRVDLALLPDGGALVSWLERADEGAEIRVRRVSPEGRAGRARVVASSSASRASGFPQMVVTDDAQIVFAWTDPGDAEGQGRVRVATADLPELP